MRDDRHRDQGMGGLPAFIAGVVLGGVAVFLLDDKNREKLQRKSDDLKGLVNGKLDEVEDEVQKAKEKTKKEISKTLKEAGKRLDN